MKNSENKMLDQLLKDQLAEGSAPVPDFVWDRIEEELFPEKKRRFFFWWWFFGGIGILLIGCLALFLRFGSEHSQGVDHTQKQISNQQTPGQNTTDPKIAVYRKSAAASEQNGSFSTQLNQQKVHSEKSVDASSHHLSSKNAPGGAVHQTSKSKTVWPAFKTGNATSTLIGNNPGDSDPSDTKSVADSKTDQIPDGQNVGQPENKKEENQSGPSEEKTPEITAATTKSDSVDYTHIYELLQRRYPVNGVPKEWSKFSIGIYGGASFYDIAVFKDYFTSGQLSNRTFASSGFEAGFNARFNIGNRFTIYSGLAFNQKQSQFNYNVAITQADYFTNVVNGNKVPLANIVDNGVNSCFLAKGVRSKYSITSTLFSLGTTYEFWRSGKFSAAADLRFSFNVQSAMKLSEMTVIDIPQPPSERFCYFQPGLGVLLDYQLNRRISVGLSPMFSKQFYTKESFVKKVNELVVPVTLKIRF